MWYKIVLILIILILFFVAVMVIDNHRFVVRRYTLRSKRIRYPVRFVFVADLHEKSYGKENEALVDAIAALSPDAVLVGGDLIVSGRIKREAARKNGDAEPGPSDTNWMKHSHNSRKRKQHSIRLCQKRMLHFNINMLIIKQIASDNLKPV